MEALTALAQTSGRRGTARAPELESSLAAARGILRSDSLYDFRDPQIRVASTPRRLRSAPAAPASEEVSEDASPESVGAVSGCLGGLLQPHTASDHPRKQA